MSAAFSPLPLSKVCPGPDALPPFSVLNSLFQDTFSNLSSSPPGLLSVLGTAVGLPLP